MNYIKIKKIIDNWDPIDLWLSHCPMDEYDVETKKIVTLIENVKDENRIAEIIYTVLLLLLTKIYFTINLKIV
jgi:hypothetical protein